MTDSSTAPSLAELDHVLPFVRRHIGLSDTDVATMLARLGYDSLDDLMTAAVPAAIRSTTPVELPARSRRPPPSASCGPWPPPTARPRR